MSPLRSPADLTTGDASRGRPQPAPRGPRHVRSTDTVVVGGGLTGCAAAYYLARAGVDVVLLDRSELNTEASGRNAGSLHAQIQFEPFEVEGEQWARDWTPTIPFLLDAIALWRTLPEELGVDLELSVKGGILAAETQEQLAAVERKAAIESAAGLQVELLSRAELRRVAPYLSPQMIGGLLCPAEGKANPLLATPAFAQAAMAAGARIAPGVEVLAIEREREGFSIETGAGKLRCAHVVDCAGVAAGTIASLVGVDLPVETHPLQAHVTEPVAPLVEHLVYFAGERLTVKQARVGSILIGGGWPSRADERTGRLTADPASTRANLRVAQHVVPALAQARLLRIWTGACNGTPDHRPILGELPGVPGFFLGVFPFLGFTAAPLVGKLVANLVRGRPSPYELAPFSPSRFG